MYASPQADLSSYERFHRRARLRALIERAGWHFAASTLVFSAGFLAGHLIH